MHRLSQRLLSTEPCNTCSVSLEFICMQCEGGRGAASAALGGEGTSGFGGAGASSGRGGKRSGNSHSNIRSKRSREEPIEVCFLLTGWVIGCVWCRHLWLRGSGREHAWHCTVCMHSLIFLVKNGVGVLVCSWHGWLGLAGELAAAHVHRY